MRDILHSQLGQAELPLEAWSFNRQQVLDVGWAGEDAFEVDPTTLNVNPDIKQRVDSVQFVFPRQRLLLKLLHITC